MKKDAQIIIVTQHDPRGKPKLTAAQQVSASLIIDIADPEKPKIIKDSDKQVGFSAKQIEVV